MTDVLAKCPFCGINFDASDYEWICPVCTCVNDHSNPFENCAFCRFNPRLVKCHNCDKNFETALLMGEFEGPYGRIFPPEEYPILTRSRYQFKDLENIASLKNIPKTQIKKFIRLSENSEYKKTINESSFEFPYRINSAIIYSVFENPKNTLWVHFGLYQENPLPKMGISEANGQMSMKIAETYNFLDVETIITDIQMI